MASNKQVKESIKRILNVCGEVLLDKGEDYSGGDQDRLQNFKAGGAIGSLYNHDVDQKQVLWGYLLKHLTSINYMCRMTKELPDRAQWDEKIGDAINYLLLLSAMVDEEIRYEKTKRMPEREPSTAWTVAKTKKTKEEHNYMASFLFEEHELQKHPNNKCTCTKHSPEFWRCLKNEIGCFAKCE